MLCQIGGSYVLFYSPIHDLRRLELVSWAAWPQRGVQAMGEGADASRCTALLAAQDGDNRNSSDSPLGENPGHPDTRDQDFIV